MYNILTIGDIKLDTFILIEDANVMCELKMPACKLCIEYGKKIPVKDIDTQIAGSAPNVAIGLAKMKKSTAVYAQMGKDILHRLAVEFLKENKVDTKFVKATTGVDTPFAAVLNFKGESTQLVSHDGIEYRLPKRLPATEWVHVSELGNGYEKLYRDLIALSKKKRVKISFNPGVVQIAERKKALLDLLKETTVLFLNKSEAEDLVQSKGKIEMHSLVAELKKLGPNYVVITDGRNGAYSYNGAQLDYAPMFPGGRVEATGAGDAFTTGFLGAIMHDRFHSDALRWASVNAASVVGEIGPTKGLLTHTEIKKRLKARPSYKTKEL